jgi:Cys-rich protein (TIGR04453 family)
MLRRALEAFLVSLVMSTLVGCEDGYCTKVCKRVAFCKEEASKSPERVLGEREPPANPACMERCKAEGEQFATCEETKRTCSKLRDCLGADFGD